MAKEYEKRTNQSGKAKEIAVIFRLDKDGKPERGYVLLEKIKADITPKGVKELFCDLMEGFLRSQGK